MAFSVTAVVLGHANKEGVVRMIQELKEQTVPPDRIITIVCCMDVSGLEGMVIRDEHINDTGQRFCDWGLRLSDTDYTFFASCDDGYDPTFIEKCLQHDADLILVGFKSHLVGDIPHSEPQEARVTRGSFMVKTRKGQEVGYTSREYSGDWHFIRDMLEAGATWVAVDELLHFHN